MTKFETGETVFYVLQLFDGTWKVYKGVVGELPVEEEDKDYLEVVGPIKGAPDYLGVSYPLERNVYYTQGGAECRKQQLIRAEEGEEK